MSARIFLIRHGQTEGTQGVQHISSTDHKLSTEGEKQVEWTREKFVGEGKLIDPKSVSRM
jgi:broad specificity phosphatase PhoE